MTNHENDFFPWICDITFNIHSKFHLNPFLSEGYMTHLLIIGINVAVTNVHRTAVKLLGQVRYGVVWKRCPLLSSFCIYLPVRAPEKPWTLHHTLQVTGIIKHFDTDKLIYKICLNACFLDRKGRYFDIHSSRLRFFCGRLLWWFSTAEPFPMGLREHSMQFGY